MILLKKDFLTTHLKDFATMNHVPGLMKMMGARVFGQSLATMILEKLTAYQKSSVQLKGFD
jgi:hypothetical protein